MNHFNQELKAAEEQSSARSTPLEAANVCLEREESQEGTSRYGNKEHRQMSDLDSEELNQALEIFSQTYNLTAHNVKNIIFHIVKNPQTFATLVRRDPDAIAGLRMTRSRLRQLERIAKRSIPPTAELRPIGAPRTFLDVNYGEGEEDADDADYSPKNDEVNDGEKELGSESSENEGSTDIEEEEKEAQCNGEEHTAPESTLEIFQTNVDNPFYPLFVKSATAVDDTALDPKLMEQLYDEENDPEYVFQEFDEFCEQEDEYEYRRDRATEIPRWEVKALEKDFLEEPSVLDVPRDSEIVQMQQSKISVTRTNTNGQKTKDATTQLKQLSKQFSTNLVREEIQPNSAEGNPPSCSLLADEVQFTREEIKALQVQLQKHVQLLCQAIVGTTQYVELLDSRNRATKMLRDLDQLAFESREEQHLLLANIPNLEAAIYTSHDILACREVELALEARNEQQPSNEVMWVLSRSQALVYPELVSPYRFRIHTQSHSHFLPSEQLLLALALYQLNRVPHANKHSAFDRERKGRYPLIADHFLPGKTVTQIRNHLKNVRSCTAPSILHQMICQAERGKFHTIYHPDMGETVQTSLPIEWPEQMQPFWLKWLAKLLSEHRIDIVMDGNIGEERETKTTACGDHELLELIVRKRLLSSGTGGDDRAENGKSKRRRTASSLGDAAEEMAALQPIGPNSNEPFLTGTATCAAAKIGRQIGEDVSEMLPGTSSSKDSLTTTAQLQQQKKSQRKQRTERGLTALYDPNYREQSWNALVEAIYSDFKQRMFMHQHKLRSIQSVLVRPGMSMEQRFGLLWEKMAPAHAELFYLFAAIAPELELPHPLRLDPNRLAAKRALRMLHTIQTYIGGSRSALHSKNTFKFLKELQQNDTIASEQQLFETLQRHFGIRDEPLWRHLRREWMDARFTEKIEDWQYETIDLARVQQEGQEERDRQIELACEYEMVKMPYRHDLTERNRLRVRHGRVTAELNGKIRNVTIGYDLPQKGSSSVNDHREMKSRNEVIWTRGMDATLLNHYNKTKGNRQKCIGEFLQKQAGDEIDFEEANKRLESLLQVANKLRMSGAGK